MSRAGQFCMAGRIQPTGVGYKPLLYTNFARKHDYFILTGIFSLSGTSMVTYLYGAYVFPLRPIFVLLWFAALILTAGGFIGHCFHIITSLMTTARRVVAPMPLDPGS